MHSGTLTVFKILSPFYRMRGRKVRRIIPRLQCFCCCLLLLLLCFVLFLFFVFLLLFFSVEVARAHYFLSLGQDQSTETWRAETTAEERYLASCM